MRNLASIEVYFGVYLPTGGALVFEKNASYLASLSVDLKLESHICLVILSTSSLIALGSILLVFSNYFFKIFFGKGSLSKLDFFYILSIS